MWTGEIYNVMINLLVQSKCPCLTPNTQQLVGFARVMTDEVRYAYIYDVMVEESLRGQALGKQIMQSIQSHPSLSQIKYIELTCAPNMSDYYAQFGFNRNFRNVIPMRNYHLHSAKKN